MDTVEEEEILCAMVTLVAQVTVEMMNKSSVQVFFFTGNKSTFPK